MTTPLQANVVDGQPDHAGKHNAERTRIEYVAGVASSAASTAAAAASTAAAANTLAGQKYTKPTQGIPIGDLTTALQTVLNSALVVTSGTTRPAVSNPVLFTGADPGTNAQAGVDLWIGDIA